MKKTCRRFRCGRAILTKKGTVKKLDLGKGGGSRFIEWYNRFMNFDDVRDYLINLYNLGNTEYEISLYDYQLNPLNVDQYNTVWNYVRRNGLNCNSTLIYLCTREVDYDPTQKKVMKKKKKTSNEDQPVIKVEPDSDAQRINLSLFDYPFKKSIRDLVDGIRDLINRYPGDEVLVRLFEESCIMCGYIGSIIDPLQQNLCLQSRNSSQFLNSLNDIQNICESIENSMNLNKQKLNQLKHFPVINDLFIQFHQNFENLRDQCVKLDETNDGSGGASSSFVNLTSTYSNNRSLFDDPNYATPRRPNEEICTIFQPLLNSATDLLDMMDSGRLGSFQGMIKWFITDLESIRANVDINNHQSLSNTKQALTSLKTRYARKFNDRVLKSSVYQFTQPVKLADKKTFRLICDLLSTIQQYQQKLNKPNPVSTSSRQEQSEDHLSIQPKKIKLEKFDHDRKRKIDIAVYSSSDI